MTTPGGPSPARTRWETAIRRSTTQPVRQPHRLIRWGTAIPWSTTRSASRLLPSSRMEPAAQPVYDDADRPVAAINPLENRTTTVYDKTRAVASINALGDRSTTVYDAAGRKIANIDPLGRRATTVYNAVGQVIATVNPEGARGTSVYDDAGRNIAASIRWRIARLPSMAMSVGGSP